MISASETIINKVRVPAGRGDPLSLRLRLGHMLSNLSLTPSGLSPASIVCIRRLRDPRPGLLDLAANTFRPAFDWERAVTEKIEELVSRAARAPCDGIPADAECVVFADKADLMASLAGDWCEGSVATRWWWQALLKKADMTSVCWNVWRNAPEYIPTALQHLANKNRAGEFARALSETEARGLSAGVARSFALQSLMPLLHHEPFNGSGPLDFVAQVGPAASSLRAPWQRWVPESEAAGLGAAQQLFLGVALMVQRAPAVVRTSSFASDVDSWQREIALRVSMMTGPDGPAETKATHSQRPAPDESGTATLSFQSTDGPTAALSETAAAPKSPRELPPLPNGNIRPVYGNTTEAQSDQLTSPASGRSEGTSASSAASAKEAEISAVPDTQRQAIELADTRSDRLPEVDGEVAAPSGNGTHVAEGETALTDQFAVLEEQVETQFGGLFYLINLALYLDLYSDFTPNSTAQAKLGIGLDIWDFVALVGRELVGDAIHSDPVWTLLAQLAARDEHDSPGRDFEPDDDWHIPAAWLEPFSNEGPCAWTTANGRLRVLHPDQFPLLDVPLQPGNVFEQLQQQLRAYESLGFRISTLESDEDPLVDRELKLRTSTLETVSPRQLWLSRLMPYVRARLKTALGLKDGSEAAAVLCKQEGRVFISATHVDVLFRLADLPIQIRVAGLDRNPGWVPAAGRFIAFYFE